MEYRYKSLDNKHYIEKNKLGYWEYCFHVDSFEVAMNLIKNPRQIEMQLKIYKVSGILVLSFLVIGLILVISEL